jgi:DNA-binding transcriptional MerR regulator
MAQEFTIGHMARETGCKIPTIRYYEQIGLLPEPRRTRGNTRAYDASHLARLSFIQHCRSLGFSQSAIRDLLTLTDQPDQTCEAVTQIARGHLADVNARIARLSALKGELEQMISSCSGGRMEQCRIIEVLADHSHPHCVTKAHRGQARNGNVVRPHD